MVIKLIALPLIAFVIGIFFLGLFRKIAARIHRRYGPPLTQPVIDIIKLFYQKSVSHGRLFDFGIIVSLAGSLAVILFLPFAGICPLESSGGLLVIAYLLLFAPLGIALSGGEGANPNISIGISRKLILSLGYEVPLILILLAVMTHYKTISIAQIVSMQQKTGWAVFSAPLFLSGISYILILPAMLGVRPFDIASAPQEISSGVKVEYGGKFLALATIEHAFHLFIGISLFVNLFLGGGNVFVFFLKMIFVFIAGVFVHSVFPRFRTEQAVKYLWGWPALIALLGLVLAVTVK